MKVLFISTSLPPNADSQAIRSLYLMQGLDLPQWEWTFLTPDTANPAAGDFECLMPEGTRTVRTGEISYHRWNRRVSKRLGKKAVWVFSNVFHRLAIPDVHAGWQRQAIKAGRMLLNEEKFDVIVSASGSATAHLAAVRLASQFDMPWVADFGDPWHLIDRENRPLVSPVSYFLERRVIRRPNHVIFTTEATRRVYQEWLGKALPPCSVLPYGFLSDDFPPDSPSKPEPGTRSIAHIGAAFAGNRTLIPAIRAIHATPDSWTLDIIGDHSAAFEAEAERLRMPNVRFRNRVSYSESIEATRRSDALIIVGNKGGLQIPGKVFVCLGSGKPIAYLYQRDPETDPAWAILKNFWGVVHGENTDAGASRVLAELSSRFEELQEEARKRQGSPELGQLEATALSQKFGEILQSVARCSEKAAS